MAIFEGRGLFPLLRLQAGAFLYSLGARRGSGSGHLRVVGACALIALLATMAAVYMWTLGSGMVAVGAEDAIPALAALMGSLAAVALVFVKAPGTVFGCRDYDLVAALPVSVRTVVLARTAPLYGFGIALSALLSVPLYVAYFSVAPVSPATVAAAAVISLLAPLAPSAVAVLISLALTSVAVRFRHASVVQLILSALLVVGVVAGSFAFSGSFSGADDVAVLAAVGDTAGALTRAVSSAYPPAAWAGAAVVDGSMVGLIVFCMLSLVLPALVTVGLAACYPTVNALTASGPRGRRGQVKAATAMSPVRALTIKELRRIGSMPFYAMNDCVGLLLMVTAAVAASVFGVDALLTSGAIDGVRLDAQAMEAMRVPIDAALPWVFGFCGTMSLTAGPSVSLEARTNWLMLTAPVGTGTVLASKLLANIVLGGIAIAVSALALLVGGTAPLIILQCVVCAMGMLVGFASIALAIDASRPNFSWASPSEIIKRGLPVMVGSLGGALVSFGFGFLSVTAAGVFGAAASTAINFAAPMACAFAGLAVFRVVAFRGFPGPGWD